MSVRFDWDILLEKVEPKPGQPETANVPPPTQREAVIERQSAPEQNETEEKPEHKPIPRVSVAAPKRQIDILRGKITPELIVNGFIMSEVLGPPGGLGKGRYGRYYKSKY
ncbi:hypothetical protein [Desulfofalx alkaliphila]|uniref:hypothetical protein n=1 Tax=Desulfofalx alkaliphila TaxID=105483 RepID=UPI0004E0BCA8|nr:hypothetical protein [Desulfofalx alkaliphila]